MKKEQVKNKFKKTGKKAKKKATSLGSNIIIIICLSVVAILAIFTIIENKFKNVVKHD